MNEAELKKRVDALLDLMRWEQKLRVEICSLNLGLCRGTELKKNLERHDEILAEIDELRHAKMMPILRDVARFVNVCKLQERAKAR